MQSRIIILVLLAGVITVAVLLFTMKGRPGMSGAMPMPPPDSAAKPSDQKIIGGGVVTWGNHQMQLGGSPKPQAPPPVDAEFQKFLSDEAKQVDATHIDGEAKRKELAGVVAKLTPTQAKQLLQTVQSPASSAGERILSAYLMVEAGPRAEAELKALITAPIANPGAHETHSEDELRAMQERSVRAMAIDGLISRAQKEPSAREALAKAIPDIPDPYIKNYAEKRLAEIKAH